MVKCQYVEETYRNYILICKIDKIEILFASVKKHGTTYLSVNELGSFAIESFYPKSNKNSCILFGLSFHNCLERSINYMRFAFSSFSSHSLSSVEVPSPSLLACKIATWSGFQGYVVSHVLVSCLGIFPTSGKKC